MRLMNKQQHYLKRAKGEEQLKCTNEDHEKRKLDWWKFMDEEANKAIAADAYWQKWKLVLWFLIFVVDVIFLANCVFQ